MRQTRYNPDSGVKLAGKVQEAYPRKNWSSMVLYNCEHPANANLTLEMINTQPGSFLHRFSWIDDDRLIGEISHEWNFLVEWYKPTEGKLPKALHYTEGGPWFPDYRNTMFSDLWFNYLRLYEETLNRPRLLCPFERFSVKGSPILEGYDNSSLRWSPQEDE